MGLCWIAAAMAGSKQLHRSQRNVCSHGGLFRPFQGQLYWFVSKNMQILFGHHIHVLGVVDLPLIPNHLGGLGIYMKEKIVKNNQSDMKCFILLNVFLLFYCSL